MYKVLITGPIGSGKTAVGLRLQELGAERLDLDAVGAEVRNRPEVTAEIVESFGTDILDEDGVIVPRRLASLVFNDSAALDALNAICLPRIVEVLMRHLDPSECTEVDSADDGIFVAEFPLLPLRPDIAHFADEVIAVSLPEKQRVDRLVQRGLAPDDARARIASQAPNDTYLDLATTVFDNSGTPAELQEQVDAWHAARTGERLF